MEDLDQISQSMRDMLEELDALDTVEKKTAYCKDSDLTLEQLEDFSAA